LILVTHALIGAGIGSLIPGHPIGVFAAGFVSHFALDAIPHWDYPLRSLFKGAGQRAPLDMDSGFFVDVGLIAIDGLAGLALAAWLFSNPATWIAVILGAFGGMTPDALQFAHRLFPYEPLRTLQRFHMWIHTRTKLGSLTGVTTQLALAVIAVQVFKSLDSGALSKLIN
jgi:hypothetical protein